jgi:metallo-beta-lactamase family protein
MKIHFKGATRTVTGSKYLLETNEGLKVLLDCGMYQGKEGKGGRANREFGFDPASVDYMVLSHAHIDHSGLIPKLVKDGFNGPIYCTEPTRALCQIMLADSAHIQMYDTLYHKKTDSHEEEEPLYDIDDVVAAMALFVPLSYGEWHVLSDKLTLMFTHVGHIIGSGCVNLRIKEGKKTHSLAFTGDIGRRQQKIIKGWEPFPQAEIVITESTYGDRLHADVQKSESRLLDIVYETCVEKKGKLIIPAFSLGRTQEIVYALDQLESKGLLPPIKVFVDSPLSTNATEIVQSFPEEYNKRILKYMERDANPFGFQGLHYVREAKYSKQINTLREPCIIISASGMIEAGRILHHVRNNISNPDNTLLIVGYCEPSSIGGQLRAGADSIKIFGSECKVKARIEVMDEYSAHGDYEEMEEYLSCQTPHLIKKLFLVHGRYEVQEVYKDYLTRKGFHHIEIPSLGDVVDIS